MTPSEINWRSGRIVFWDEAVGAPLSESVLKEDLVQVVFRCGLVLDLGWYPQGSVEGSFVVCLVKDEDWDAPLMRKEVRTISEVAAALQEGADLAERTAGKL